MCKLCPHSLLLSLLAALTAALAPARASAACCYFSAKDQDILQPGQKAFITWDANEKIETFTVQPKFEGNALDFGMVIPTPSRPKLAEMPRDFFKHLAVYSMLKKREFPRSRLLPEQLDRTAGVFLFKLDKDETVKKAEGRPPAVKVLEAGVVGSLDYKIIEAGRADDLYQWLKDNKYSYSGDEATLGFYVQKKWIFTVMKIDTMQMKKNKDGSFVGEVTLTRFQFASDKIVYPLKITQISVKDKTEALFYVQAPFKTDLEGEFSYQRTWVPMLKAASGCTPGGLPGGGEQWLKSIDSLIPDLLRRNQGLGYNFVAGQRPERDKKGHIATTMEWAHKLTDQDIRVLKGESPYSEKVPDVDEGFTQADINDPKKGPAIVKVIEERLAKARKERPLGFLVREAPVEDVRALHHLAGHLRSRHYITKFRKIFARDEMGDDLTLVAARMGNEDDRSEYEEILPTSPP